MRPCSLLLCLAVLAAGWCPAAADDDPPKIDDNAIRLKIVALVKQLDDDDEATRAHAEKALARYGAKARGPLEALIGPPDSAPAPAPTAAQKTRIAELIEQLSARKYRDREKATDALIEMGKVVTNQLRAVLKHEDPEVSRRARAILDRLYPPRKVGDRPSRARATAARLLARLADARSEPALRHLLKTARTTDAAADAALALRAIRRDGPTVNPLRFQTAKDRAARAAEWATFLAKPRLPLATEPVELKPAATKGERWTLTVESAIEWGIDLSALLERAGGGPAGVPMKMGATTTVKSAFKVGVNAAAPLSLALDCTEYDEKTKNVAGGMAVPAGGALGGAAPAKDAVWKANELALVVGPKGAELTAAGKPSPAGTNSRQLQQLALILAATLPEQAAGTYRPGTPRDLPKGFVDRLRHALYKGSIFEIKLTRALARMTYLRQTPDKNALFYLELAARRDGLTSMFGNISHPTLAGPVLVDLARGRVLAMTLSGPVHGMNGMRQRIALGGAGATKQPSMRSYLTLRLIADAPDGAEKTEAPKDAPKKDAPKKQATKKHATKKAAPKKDD